MSKYVFTNGSYKVVNGKLVTYDELPKGFYTVHFDPNNGFYLSPAFPIELKEKSYGYHEAKAQKVINAFQRSERNLGVILSGDKGIGKSLCAKMIAVKASEIMPVIIVTQYISGMADFLNDLSDECLILFDEFDKAFGVPSSYHNTLEDPQTEMLSLFDGMSQNKKLFVITCNEIVRLNDYLINRPGRFHYHFRFDYPDADAISVFLSDRGIDQKQIEKVINFSRQVKLNYDCLRSIAFELAEGEDFSEVIQDLNIRGGSQFFNIIVRFTDGEELMTYHHKLDFFSQRDSEDNQERIQLYTSRYNSIGSIFFNVKAVKFDNKEQCFITTDAFEMRWASWLLDAWDDLDKGEELDRNYYDATEIESIYKYRNKKVDKILFQVEEVKWRIDV